MKKDIVSMLPEELEQDFALLGEQKFRAKQVFQWISRGVRDFDKMTNLSKPLREKLKGEYELYEPKVIGKQVSAIDGTIKYLWELKDGNAVETVVMSYKHGNTVCVSSQVGCRQGCAFCASTIGGLVRNLEPSEILDEVLFSQLDSGKTISNIVLMGIGEPLDNYNEVLKFLEIVNHPSGLNIGHRHITLSTCGLVPKIKDLADRQLQITLSVSLHAADDETRSEIMPVNRRYSISQLMEACRYYIKKTNRRISFEYTLISGVNDNSAEAEKLLKLLHGMLCHVNLIPVNPVKETGFKQGSRAKIEEFQRILESGGISATIRREMGADISAACGQLRASAKSV